MDMEQFLLALVGSLGPAGVLAWHLYHTTTKTIPDIVTAHRKEMVDENNAHRKEMSELLGLFRSDLAQERQLRETLLRDVLAKAAISCPAAAQTRRDSWQEDQPKGHQ